MLASSTPAWEQVLVIVVGGLLMIGIPILIRFLSRISSDVHYLIVAWVGEKPSRRNPHPKPGMMASVDRLVKDSKPGDGTTSRDVIDRIDPAPNGGS